MKWVLAAAAAVVLVAGCGGGSSHGHTPDQKACKAAMVQEYKQALKTGQTGSQPAPCAGLSDAALQKLADQVMTEVTGQ